MWGLIIVKLVESIVKRNAMCLPFRLIQSKFPIEDHLHKA